MGLLVTISQFLLALAILVTLHELGHFAAARAFGIKVEKFYLFFDAWGFKLFSFKRGDTEYGIGWLPLGGYVKIAGMIDESLDTKQMSSEVQPWEFRGKPAWQRLIVMLGGVIVNFILGMAIFGMLLWISGDSYIPIKKINDRGGIYASETARTYGFKTGDKILALNGKPIETLDQFYDPKFFLSEKAEVTLDRQGEVVKITMAKKILDDLSKNEKSLLIQPLYEFDVKEVIKNSPADKAGIKAGDKLLTMQGKSIVYFPIFKEYASLNKGKMVAMTWLRGKDTLKGETTLNTDGTLGFSAMPVGLKDLQEVRKVGFFASLAKGAVKGIDAMYVNIVGLGKVITGEVKAKNALRGPIGMAEMYGSVWDWGWFWNLTAMLSLGLAFANLLPIPALDGGHVVFLLWEMITGKPVSEKVLYAGQVVGMVLILSLIAFLFWNDIARLLGM